MNYLKQRNLEVTDKDKELFLRNKEGKLIMLHLRSFCLGTVKWRKVLRRN